VSAELFLKNSALRQGVALMAQFSLQQAEQALCDFGAVLHPSARLFTDVIGENRLLYGPDTAGMPVLVDAARFDLLNRFHHGATVGEVITAIQGRGELSLPEIIETVGLFEERGFLTGHAPGRGPDKLSKLPPVASLRSMNVWLHVCNHCNLDCAYCFVNKGTTALTDDTIGHIVDRMQKTVRAHCADDIVIKFAGGEPTLRMDIVESFYARLTERLAGEKVRLRWAFITNGTVATRRFTDFVKTAKASVNVSLDGYGAYHDVYRIYKAPPTGSRVPEQARRRGSWHKISANIDALLAMGIKPNVNTTVSFESAPGLTELTRWVAQRNMMLHFGVVRNLDCDWRDGGGRRSRYREYCEALETAFEQAFQELERPEYAFPPDHVEVCELRFNHPSAGVCCGIGASHIVIREDGKLASCPMTASEQAVEPSDDLFESSRRTFDIDPDERGDAGECLSCDWYRVCAGGCPVANQRFNGHPFTRSPLCQFWKYVIPRYLRFYGVKLAQRERS
jgi:uncharacterized protein